MKKSQTDMRELRHQRPEEIDLSDIPELGADFFERAVRRVNGVEVPRKQRVNIMLDRALVARFKAKAGERGYQTLINQALRDSLGREDMLTAVRRVVREELAVAHK